MPARPKVDPANFAATCAAWYQDALSTPAPPAEPLRIMNVRANEPLTSPFNLRPGVNGFGIGAAGAKADQAGHFVRELMDAGSRRPVQTFDLKNRATQGNVFVGTGSYVARLRLLGANGADLLPATETPLRVTREDPM